MRRLLGLQASVRRIYAYTAYIHDRLAKGFAAASVVVSLAHSMAVVTGLPSFATDPSSALLPLLMMTSLIYYISIVYIAYSMAQELGEGPAALYLSHPLGRVEYLLSWFAAGLLTTSILYLASIVAPVLVMDPALVSSVDMAVLATLVFEGLVTGAFVFLVALLTRRRGATFFAGLVYILVVPLALSIVAAIVAAAVPRQTLVETLVKTVFMLLYPCKYYAIERPTNAMATSMPSALLSLVLLGSCLVYAKRKLEV